MKIVTLLTADYATVEKPTGKLHILGAFTRIYARKFPCIHNRMAVIVKIRPDFGDHSGARELSIVLEDEDGTELMLFSVPFEFPFGDGGTRPEFIAVLEMNNIQFHRPGLYEFKVNVDSRLEGSTAIELVQAEVQ